MGRDGGDCVVVLGTHRAGTDSGSFEAPFAHVMKFEDDKVVRGEFHADSAKAAKRSLDGQPLNGRRDGSGDDRLLGDDGALLG